MRLTVYAHLLKLAAAALGILLLASCNGTPQDATDGAPASQPGSPASSGATVDLSSVDACSLLTEATVQQITGESVDFTTDSSGDQGRSAGCFWGATQPGIGAYVEVTLNAQSQGIDTYRFGADLGCSEASIEGAGIPVEGGTCPGDQEKVYVAGYDRGVLVVVLVNDAQRPLTPDDLVETATGVVDQL